MNHIRFNSISYKYPDNTLAIDNLSFSINKGSCLSILGENGSGKSTLLMLLKGIIHPCSGTYYFNDQLIKNKNIRILMKEVGYVFQDPDVQLFAPTVYQEISFGLKNFKIKDREIKRIIDNVLEEFKITEIKNKLIHNLSYGQKKLVSIASICAMDPDVILLDEPTASLDYRHKKIIIDLIKNLLQKNKTIIISTHDTELAYTIADHIFILETGKLKLEGPTHQIFEVIMEQYKNEIEIPFFLESAKYMNLSPLPRNRREYLTLVGGDNNGL